MTNFILKIPLTLFIISLSFFISPSRSLANTFEPFPETTSIHVVNQDELALDPLQNEKPNWIIPTWIIGTTVLLYQNDQQIQNFFQGHQSQSTRELSSFFRNFGSNSQLFPSLGLFYLYGTVRQDEKSQRCAILSMESILLATLFTNTIKFSTHRSRPNTGESYDSWGEPSLEDDNDYLSFPSGHATSVFSVATVIATEYKENPYIPGLSYSIASLTAISRVHDNRHWASDIFMGSVIGYFTGKWVIKLNNRNENTFAIAPVLRDRGYGLAVTIRF